MSDERANVEQIMDEIVSKIVKERQVVGKVVRELIKVVEADVGVKKIFESILRCPEGKANAEQFVAYFVDLALKVQNAAEYRKNFGMEKATTEQLLQWMFQNKNREIASNNQASRFVLKISPLSQATNVQQLIESGVPIDPKTDLEALVESNQPAQIQNGLYQFPYLDQSGTLHGVPTFSEKFQVDLQNCGASVNSGLGDIDPFLRISESAATEYVKVVLQEIQYELRRQQLGRPL